MPITIILFYNKQLYRINNIKDTINTKIFWCTINALICTTFCTILHLLVH